MCGEGGEDLLGLLGRQSAVRHSDARIGHLTLDEACQALDILDAAIDEVDLPPAAQLIVHGLADHLGRGLAEHGLDGSAIGGRRVEVRQVPCSHQRELQGTGYRRGTHGQRIYVDLQLTQALLDGDTELLLLVNDQ